MITAPPIPVLLSFAGITEKLFMKDVGAAIGRPGDAPLAENGLLVKQAILNIPKHYPATSVDYSVILLDHIRLLLQISTDADGRPMAAPAISTAIPVNGRKIN